MPDTPTPTGGADVICLDGGLFPEPARAAAQVPAPRDHRGRAQRRQERQAAAIELGQHPLSVALGISIPLTPAVRDGVDLVRPSCGDCALRQPLSGGNRSFPKCTARPVERSRVDEGGRTWTWHEYPRATHGEGTDVRAWWPACTDYLEA
jgi:hypothetical protein